MECHREPYPKIAMSVVEPSPPDQPDVVTSTAASATRLGRSMHRRWLIEGARTAVLVAPRWQGMQAPPMLLLGLVLLNLLIVIGAERLWLTGAALFNWRPLLAGWLGTCALAWVAYGLRPGIDFLRAERAPGAGHLFALLVTQACLLDLLYGGFWVGFIRLFGADALYGERFGDVAAYWVWGAWIALLAWQALANAVLLARATGRRLAAVAAALLLGLLGLAEGFVDQQKYWVADPTDRAAYPAEPVALELTQEVIERQPVLLAERLEALQGQRPGLVDVYALTFAPYAAEDVFSRESAMVAEVMGERFDAEGRVLQLVNHAQTLSDWPWATALNLQRAITRIAGLMDKDEDVLFIHLTSHGAQNGDLAAQFWPLSVAPITVRQLKTWLDEAGIRHRVISISACYSGAWIDPLADEHTLVMTAADAEHTSYGCGRHSELTFFGRAVFDEQLRLKTRSFTEAHAAARLVIEQREQEAGKDDGYSNPQIRVGAAIAARLQRLREQLERG